MGSKCTHGAGLSFPSSQGPTCTAVQHLTPFTSSCRCMELQHHVLLSGCLHCVCCPLPGAAPLSGRHKLYISPFLRGSDAVVLQ